jgi:hypothetical protein
MSGSRTNNLYPPISEGEAADMRRRLSVVEDRLTETDIKVDVHEQKCASRYLQIIILLVASIGMNVPTSLPTLLKMIGILGH